MTPHWTERCIDLRAWLTSHPRVFVGLDFDGTLAPLAAHPGEVRLPEPARTALLRMMELPGVMLGVISGRSLKDLADRVNMPGLMYAGNHGLEMMTPDGGVEIAPGAGAGQHELEQVLAGLAPVIATVPGAWIEDKHLSASVHYRLADEADHGRVELMVKSAMRETSHLSLHSGKRIWEIRPAIHWHKGSALTWFMHRCDVATGAAVFMGDDLTDYDAFEVLAGGWGFFVGEGAPSTVSARLDDVQDTVRLLEWMVRVRREATYLVPADA